MAIETLQVVQQFTTLDLLLYRRFGNEREGRVEAVFAMNADLAGLGAFLPLGTLVKVEIESPKTEVQTKRVVRLWE